MRLPQTLLLLAALLPGIPLIAEEKLADGLYAEFTTPHGAFLVELHYRQAPLTVANFVGLADGTLAPRADRPYYAGLKWYRVVPGFVIQSGNPLAPAEGDTGYTFPDEFVPGLHHGGAGILSMANAGPDTNSGEFFVTLADCTRLNYMHSVFGKTIRGLEVLPLIRPDDPFSIRILRVGTAAREFRANPAAFHALLERGRKYSGAPEPGPAAHFDDPAKLLPAEPPRARNFNYKLANFERATGVRIVARVFALSPPAAEDAVPGAYMQALAARLGVAQRGALAVYFADEDDWRVWLGDAAVATFLGRPATAADLAPDGAVHAVKMPFIAAAVAEGNAAYARQQQANPPDRPPPPAQRVKLQTDAILDQLILKLEPK